MDREGKELMVGPDSDSGNSDRALIKPAVTRSESNTEEFRLTSSADTVPAAEGSGQREQKNS